MGDFEIARFDGVIGLTRGLMTRHTERMQPVPLSEDELSALPPIRPRWVAHMSGLVGALAGLMALLATRHLLDKLDPIVAGWRLPEPLVILLLVCIWVVPWTLIAPLMLRVGYDWGGLILLMIFLMALPVAGWVLGFRLMRIPYRDWEPSAKQRPSARPVPDTTYHVLQADLERYMARLSQRDRVRAR